MKGPIVVICKLEKKCCSTQASGALRKRRDSGMAPVSARPRSCPESGWYVWMLEVSRSWSLLSTNCGIRNNSNKTPRHSRTGQKLLPSICVCVCVSVCVCLCLCLLMWCPCAQRLHKNAWLHMPVNVCAEARERWGPVPSFCFIAFRWVSHWTRNTFRWDGCPESFQNPPLFTNHPFHCSDTICTLLMWVLGIQIQVLMFIQQTILTTDPFS